MQSSAAGCRSGVELTGGNKPVSCLVARVFGPAESVLRLEHWAPREPGPGEVEVAIEAATINPSDLITIGGAYPGRTTLPFVAGFEAAGIVARAGRGVSSPREGDRVLPIGRAGLWCDRVTWPANDVIYVPSALSPAQAAMSYINPVTALLMIRGHAGIGPGTVVGINAANSAISRWLISLVLEARAIPIALVRRHEAVATLQTAFPSIIVLTAATGASLSAVPTLDVAFDAIGGKAGEALALRVRTGGRFIHYGLASGVPLRPDLAAKLPGVSIAYFHLRPWVQTSSPLEKRMAFRAVHERLLSGFPSAPIDSCHLLTDFQAAFRRLAAPNRVGKVLLLPRSAHRELTDEDAG